MVLLYYVLTTMCHLNHTTLCHGIFLLKGEEATVSVVSHVALKDQCSFISLRTITAHFTQFCHL